MEKMEYIYRTPAWILLLLMFLGCQKESTLPEIQFSSPFSGAKFLKGEVVGISLESKTPPSDTREIQMYINDVLVHSFQKFPVDYQWDTSETTPGKHIVKAIVADHHNRVQEINLPIEISASFKDLRDNRIYKTINIGNRIWMAQNLAYLPEVSLPSSGSGTSPHYYINGYRGTSIDEARKTSSFTKYGVLYNWPAALEACPDGWRLPADDEWKELELAMGMASAEIHKKGPRGFGLGAAMKSTSGWISNGNNLSGFSALPGGYCYVTTVTGETDPITVFGVNLGVWWSSTSAAGESAWYRAVYDTEQGIVRSTEKRMNGLSVRCVKGQPLQPS